jgi:hypothetical protein
MVKKLTVSVSEKRYTISPIKNNTVFKLILIICLSAMQTSLIAQKELSNKLGITFSSFGANDIVGDISYTNYNYKATSFYTAGFSYIRGLNKWLEIETGLEYSKHTIQIIPTVFPDMEIFMQTQKTKLSLFNLPVTLRANFLKYFFVNGGLFFDVDMSNNIHIENQTGIGGIVGLGANYDFKIGLSVFLNPYIKAHSWIYTEKQQKILEKGFRLGITYDLHRIVKK